MRIFLAGVHPNQSSQDRLAERSKYHEVDFWKALDGSFHHPGDAVGLSVVFFGGHFFQDSPFVAHFAERMAAWLANRIYSRHPKIEQRNLHLFRAMKQNRKLAAAIDGCPGPLAGGDSLPIRWREM